MVSFSRYKKLVVTALICSIANIAYANEDTVSQQIYATTNQCKAQVSDRWQVQGTALSEGDVITVMVGGFSVSYTVNANATDADEWPMYLAMKFNEEVPSSLARMGDAKSDYSSIKSATSNVIDVFVSDTPVSMHITRGGTKTEYTELAAQTVPAITYSNEMLVPNLHLSGGRALNLYFQNRTDKDLNVRAKMYDHEGKPDSVKHYLNVPFNDQNDPLKSIATLNANTTTRLSIGRDKSLPTREVQMRVQWTSDVCLIEPLLITAESVWAYDGEKQPDGSFIGAANGITRQDYGPF